MTSKPVRTGRPRSTDTPEPEWRERWLTRPAGHDMLAADDVWSSDRTSPRLDSGDDDDDAEHFDAAGELLEDNDDL